MLGGVGLAIATADVEGVALATGGFGRTHPPSVKPTRVLSARRPMDARIISPPARPRGVMVLAKISDPILRRGRSAGASGAPGLIIPYGWLWLPWAQPCQSVSPPR